MQFILYLICKTIIYPERKTNFLSEILADNEFFLPIFGLRLVFILTLGEDSLVNAVQAVVVGVDLNELVVLAVEV